MTNFDELFAQANEVGDKRRACFNRLIEKTVSEVLPRFCEVMEKFDIRQCYFKTNYRVNTYQEVQHDEDRDDFYCLCLNADKTFNDAKLNLYESRYYVLDNWKDQNFVNDQNHFTRSGIVELVKLLNSRLADLIKKYEAKVVEADNLLK